MCTWASSFRITSKESTCVGSMQWTEANHWGDKGDYAGKRNVSTKGGKGHRVCDFCGNLEGRRFKGQQAITQ